MAVLVAAPWGVLACDENTPTSLDEGRLPVDPATVEILLSWDEFARGLAVYGGFGTTNELGQGVLARAFEGTLDARTLVRFEPYPPRATVRDSAGVLRVDSGFVWIGGRVVARLDTLSSTNGLEPVTMSLGALTSEWHVRTASWTLAVDTAGDTRSWPEPGAGPVQALSEAVWDPTLGDSVVFEVDSAAVAALGDTLNPARGVRLALLTEGERIDVRSVGLRLDTRPSVHPDTVVTLNAASQGLTFVYDPVPPPPPDGIRVGGTPAWRTVLDLDVPRVLNGPPSLCAVVGCPFVLEPSRVNHASLVLTTDVVQPTAFQPTDTVRLDVRPVLAPERLPKSPLGTSFVAAAGKPVPPEAFRDGAGLEVSVPITSLVRVLVQEDPDPVPPNHVALLSVLEPLSIAFASFLGPGSVGAPFLRLIVTAADTVRLP
jgi:hypothetical protein